MRASHIAVLAAVLSIPSAAFAQQDGPVGGKVGSDLSTTTTQPTPSIGAGMRPYGGASAGGRPAGYTGAVTPGQVVPDQVQVTPRAGGRGFGLRQWSPRARRSLEPHPAGHQLGLRGCRPGRSAYCVGPTDPMIVFEFISGTSTVRAASDSSFP